MYAILCLVENNENLFQFYRLTFSGAIKNHEDLDESCLSSSVPLSQGMKKVTQ